MKIREVKSAFARNLLNIPGWKTRERYVVIESDDWGSIRMPSRAAYDTLLSLSTRFQDSAYNRYDALESQEDLEDLFEVLSGFRDFNGNYPVITANTLVANPDFNKIRDSGYSEYFYELFTDTYSKYPAHHDSFRTLKQGINSKVFYPQFHGREHLNVARWMRSLQNDVPDSRLAFDMNMVSVNSSAINSENYLQSFGLDEIPEIQEHKKIIVDGLALFKDLFGYSPTSFIAPKYTWHTSLDSVLFENGIRYFQGKGYRKVPSPDRNLIIRYSIGDKTILNQIYLRRNCIFEPSFESKDWIDSCLYEIQNAFFWNKPAVIESHRLNYIGYIVPENRERNLRTLHGLLKKVLEKWPDVQFINSAQLGDMIVSSKS